MRNSLDLVDGSHHSMKQGICAGSSLPKMVLCSCRIRWLLLLFALTGCRGSFVFHLEEDEEECVFIRTPATGPLTISGDYDCWEEGSGRVRGCRHIDVWIDQRGSSKPIWHSPPEYSEDDFFLDINPDQRYRLCFLSKTVENRDDEMEDYMMQVGFSFRVQTTERSLPDAELGPEAEKAMELLRFAKVNHELWHGVTDHYEFLRNREAVHRQLSGQINDRVMGWTIIESVVVVSMAIGQVWYWKTFFEQRRFL